MPEYSPNRVFQIIQATGLVPLFYNPDIETCKKVAKACYDGGARVFEFANRGENALEVYRALDQYVSTELPDLILGIGTVMNAETASSYMEAGANFIVSPILDEATGKICKEEKVFWVPGCGSLTEIINAEKLGAKLIKLFPAGPLGGADFIKAIKGPCPWLNIMPTSGVSPEEENLRSWFKAGAMSVGMGSKLIKLDEIDQLSFKVAATIKLIKNIRAENSQSQ